ncbi:hypothetical protein BGX28_003626 [Mortierella sp. GBA30]|nr:hypothetical protein BGX28_003626 [Mortierella sp. GBA30]
MSADTENRTMELLTTVVEDEQKNVTYRWLSRSMNISVNAAKQFMESYLSTVGKDKAHGTYYVARQDPATGNRMISLVSQSDLDVVRKDTAVVGYHIYSIEPSPLKDLALLSVSNAEALQLQKGKDINTYRVIHNNDITISKSNSRPVVAALSTPAAVAAKTAAAAAPGLSGTTAGLTSASSLSKTSLATTHPSSSSISSTTTAPSAGSKGKPSSGSKSSMMSFFGKAAAAAPKSVSAPATASTTKTSSSSASSTLNFKPAGQQKRKADTMLSSTNTATTGNSTVSHPDSDDEEEVDSEEERDRRLALSSRLDQDQGDVVGPVKTSTAHGKNGSLSVDAEAIKKRQRSARRLAVDDDDVDNNEEEDESVETMSKEARIALNKEKEAQRLALENMMLMDDTTAGVVVEDEDSPMIDVEALDSVEDTSSAPTSATNSNQTETIVTSQEGVVTRRRRGNRAVTKRKTFRNERGYMVTEDVVEMEPFSEDEIVQEAPPAPAHVDKQAEPTKSKAETGARKKAGSGNQSLLNFFSKK